MTNIFVATFYCACRLCCGPDAAGITASGDRPVEGVTVAAPRSFPLGSRVACTIPGLFTNRVFVVQDRTARRYDGRWDFFVKDHRKALQLGKKTVNIKVIK
ncbi:3D domain-containing protein [Azospirillaceae bacterium]